MEDGSVEPTLSNFSQVTFNLVRESQSLEKLYLVWLPSELTFLYFVVIFFPMVQDGCFRGRMDLFQLQATVQPLRKVRAGTHRNLKRKPWGSSVVLERLTNFPVS